VVQFWPASSDGEYRAVIGDFNDSESACLLDVKKCARSHLSIPRYFQPWTSWAPDGEHDLFYSNIETSPQLWILKIETGQISRVPQSSTKASADKDCGMNEEGVESGVG
jgi:hypothetical protein